MACTESKALKCLPIHAAHMSGNKDWASTLPFDYDEGKGSKYGEDGEQDKKAQHNVCQTLNQSVDKALQRQFGWRENRDCSAAFAFHFLV